VAINPPNVPKTLCPYTLKDLAAAIKTSDEHVIPEALGGTRVFAFRADSAKNSDLGSAVDAPLINSVLTKLLLVHYGISPLGRDVKAVLPGTIDGTEIRANATLRPGGVVDTHVHDKIVHPIDPTTGKSDRTRGTIHETADKMPDLLKAFLVKKCPGQEVRLGPEVTLDTPTLRTELTLDSAAIRRGLAKIAFGTAFFFLGDDYLNDPMVGEWHKMLFAPSRQQADQARLGYLQFRDMEDFRLVLPPVADHEHAVSIVRIGENQLAASVGLFGASWPYTIAVIASITNTYGIAEGDGYAMICDPLARKCRFEQFAPFFQAEANRRAALPPSDPRTLPKLPLDAH